MTWIQRYTQTARSYFPAAQRDDLSLELAAQLQDQLDALEAESGQAASQDQIKALVTAFGHPIRYAGAFHSRQTLISQPLLEVYKLVLQYICWVLLAVFSGYALLHALAHGEWRPLNMALSITGNTLEHFVWFFTATTAIFYFAEQQLLRALDLDDWQADQLPPLRPDWSAISRADAAFNLVLTAVLASIVFGWFPAPATLELYYPDAAALQLIGALTPVIGGVLLLFAAQHFYHCLRPYWDNLSLVSNTVLNLACVAVVALLLAIPGSDLPQLINTQPQAEKVISILNQGLHVIFWVIGALSTYEILRDLRRWTQLRRQTKV